jgi:nucleoside-diphosphate-sugar epimerase
MEPVNVGQTNPVLVTGAAGFVGRRVVERLLARGCRHVRCLTRKHGPVSGLDELAARDARVEIVRGNLLSRDDCEAAVAGAAIVVHLAAARGEKSIPDAFLNSVVTTRNLLEAVRRHGSVRRFVNVSSFTVYDATRRSRGRPIDETCPVEDRPQRRGDAYCFAKVNQDALVVATCEKTRTPYVIVRPGYVYGPGNEPITGRVGIGTFGIFLHLGGSNVLPLTYVDNCADAVTLAALTQGVDGETFNVVDDDLPSSREFLRLYKRHVRAFRSIYVPRIISYSLCALWERYSSWSDGQLPPTFNRRTWQAYWGRAAYTNEKAKRRLGWAPIVPTAEGLRRYFESCRLKTAHA